MEEEVDGGSSVFKEWVEAREPVGEIAVRVEGKDRWIIGEKEGAQLSEAGAVEADPHQLPGVGGVRAVGVGALIGEPSELMGGDAMAMAERLDPAGAGDAEENVLAGATGAADHVARGGAEMAGAEDRVKRASPIWLSHMMIGSQYNRRHDCVG